MLIKTRARETGAPDGSAFQSISIADVREIAQLSGANIREVEIAALKSGIIPLRYHRNMGTTGAEGQVKLLESRVVVVGAGGLGGHVIELLARNGIGAIVIVDGDRFSEVNLNRQLLMREDTIGKLKAEAGAERVEKIRIPSASSRPRRERSGWKR
jgi:FlaA1/EpsC-like NDP-sugar epimerase